LELLVRVIAFQKLTLVIIKLLSHHQL